jgi:hypothetical protein
MKLGSLGEPGALLHDLVRGLLVVVPEDVSGRRGIEDHAAKGCWLLAMERCRTAALGSRSSMLLSRVDMLKEIASQSTGRLLFICGKALASNGRLR